MTTDKISLDIIETQILSGVSSIQVFNNESDVLIQSNVFFIKVESKEAVMLTVKKNGVKVYQRALYINRSLAMVANILAFDAS